MNRKRRFVHITTKCLGYVFDFNALQNVRLVKMLLSTNNYRKGELEQEPHNLFVDFSESFLFDGSDKSIGSVCFGLPYPMLEPFRDSSTSTEDPLKELFNKKESYLEKLKAVKSKGIFKNVEEIDFDNGKTKYIYMPRGLLELYQFKDHNQDFTSDYNCFQTRGVLDLIYINNNRYLVWVSFNGNLSLMNTDNILDSINLTFKTNALVHGLRSYNFNGTAQIILLQTYTFTVLKILDTNNYSVIYQQCLQEIVIDAKLNKDNNNHVGILQINQELSIRSIKSNKVLFFHKAMLEISNKIMQFEFWDKSKLIIMNELYVEVFNYKDHRILQRFDPKLISCNTLCNLKILDDVLFLASRHYVIKADLNSPENYLTFAHTLESPPLFMDLIRNDKDTYLCLANHFQDDKILFTGKALFSLPYRVPSIKATLRAALLKEPDFALVNKLHERLDFTVTGLKLIELNKKVYIYCTNSLGEIFRQEISDYSVDTSDPVDNLCKWIQKLNNPGPPLFITNLTDMSDAFFFLNRYLPASEKMKEVKSEKHNGKKFLIKYRKIYGKENIKSTFAKGFCEIWDDAEESEEEDGYPEVDKFEIPYYDKVNSWMEKIDGDIEIKDEIVKFEETF